MTSSSPLHLRPRFPSLCVIGHLFTRPHSIVQSPFHSVELFYLYIACLNQTVIVQLLRSLSDRGTIQTHSSSKMAPLHGGKANRVRPASHAGSWYSGRATDLSNDLDGFLAQVESPVEGIRPWSSSQPAGPLPRSGARAIIAPCVHSLFCRSVVAII